MKTTLNFLLVLIFSLTLPNQAAAYVFLTKKDYVQTVAPPQYPLKKMSFLERIIAKHAAKKLKKSGDLILDIELVAHRAQGFGIASLVAFLGIFLFGIGLIIAPILGIIAISKANLVLNHPDATEAQKRLAKRGKIMGIISAIIGIVALIVLFIAILNFFNDFK